MKVKKLKTNLFKAFWIKEKQFWSRSFEMRKKLGWFGFTLGILLLSIAHYAFAFMHFMFECFLWIVMKDQYKSNILKMSKK